MRSLSWIIRVGPKCNNLYPYKMYTHRREGGHVTPEAAIGGMWPQAEEHVEFSEAR